MDIAKVISEELDLSLDSVENAIKLINEGDTLAFISRYRKEVTHNLTDEDLRELNKKYQYYLNLDDRAKTILDSLQAQGVLTDELKQQIDQCRKLSELEDIYRPYKPKKKTRASKAKEMGLQPLADVIINQEYKSDFDTFVKSFINEEKGVKNEAVAIQGAKDIIAEFISDNPDIRKFIKNFIYKKGQICSKEDKKDEKDTFKMYADFKEEIFNIPNFRILALNRGENLGCLKVNFEYDFEYIQSSLENKLIFKGLYEDIYKDAIVDSLKRLTLPSIENEIRSDLFTKAEDSSIIVFEKNLKQLLMYPALKNKIVLGFDPGFRTGCKIAVVNQNGDLLMVDVLNITSASQEKVDEAVAKLSNYIKKYKVDYIALGNGTASRESEAIISKMISDNKLDVKLSIVNESGASILPESRLAG